MMTALILESLRIVARPLERRPSPEVREGARLGGAIEDVERQAPAESVELLNLRSRGVSVHLHYRA